MPKTRMKPSYMVVCHRIDCGDETTFALKDDDDRDWWSGIGEARAVMRNDCRDMCESMSAGGTDGEWRFLKRMSPDEILIAVPCRNDDGDEDWIRCRWKIVKV